MRGCRGHPQAAHRDAAESGRGATAAFRASSTASWLQRSAMAYWRSPMAVCTLASRSVAWARGFRAIRSLVISRSARPRPRRAHEGMPLGSEPRQVPDDDQDVEVGLDAMRPPRPGPIHDQRDQPVAHRVPERLQETIDVPPRRVTRNATRIGVPGDTSLRAGTPPGRTQLGRLLRGRARGCPRRAPLLRGRGLLADRRRALRAAVSTT
jgi:hypothetical protein